MTAYLRVTAGAVLVLWGGLWLLKELNLLPADFNFWPPILIILGLVLLLSALVKKEQ